MTKTEDIEIIAGILGGQTERYGQLLAMYGQSILTFVCMLIPNVSDAEEVTEDAFVEAFRDLGQFDSSRSSFFTWLRHIAYHQAVHFHRRQKWKPTLLDDERISNDPDDPLSSGYPEPLDIEVDDERLQWLEESIAELDSDKRMLLQLHYFEKLPLREIAFILETKPENLANQLMRLRQKLYKMIKEKEHGHR